MKKLVIPILVLLGISVFFYVKKENEKEKLEIKNQEEIVNIEKGKILAEELYKKGITKLEYNDYRGAANDFYQATQQNPKFEKAWAKKADCEYQVREYMDAIGSYSQAIYLRNENDKIKANYYYYKGKSGIALNLIESACSDFSKAVEIDRDNFWAIADISEYCN